MEPCASGAGDSSLGQSPPGHRGAHQFHEIPTRPVVVVLRSALRKCAFEPIAKFRRVAVFADTAPVLLAGHRFRWMLKNALHRWQVWQLTLGAMCHRSFSVCPISVWVSCFFFDRSEEHTSE